MKKQTCKEELRCSHSTHAQNSSQNLNLNSLTVWNGWACCYTVKPRTWREQSMFRELCLQGTMRNVPWSLSSSLPRNNTTWALWSIENKHSQTVWQNVASHQSTVQAALTQKLAYLTKPEHMTQPWHFNTEEAHDQRLAKQVLNVIHNSYWWTKSYSNPYWLLFGPNRELKFCKCYTDGKRRREMEIMMCCWKVTEKSCTRICYWTKIHIQQKCNNISYSFQLR